MDIRLYKSTSMAQFAYNPATGAYTGTGVDTWAEFARPLEFKTKRSAGPQAGSAMIVIGGINATKDTPPVDLHQRIRLVEEDLDSAAVIFIGRVDTIDPKQDDRYGRVWVIQARDYLAALADNFVDRGKNRAFDSGGNALVSDSGVGRPVWVPKWIEKSQMDGQNSPLSDGEACAQAGEHCGTDRKYMVSELALNIVPLPFGLAKVTLPGPPNSLPVEHNFEGTRGLRIIDAINNVAAEDPWSSVVGPVDSKRANGIGGVFQIAYTQDVGGAWAGMVGQYFKRGFHVWDASITFQYGAAGKGIIPIIGYDFPQEGQAMYSRTKAIGKGEAQDTDPSSATNPGGWGSGFVSSDPPLEGSWDPSTGRYAIMRGLDEQDTSLIGRWTVEDPVAEDDNPLEVRGLRDLAASKILSVASAGQLTSRGLRRGLRGQIRVPGYPRNTNFAGIVMGTIINVKIEPALGDETIQFIVESREFTYPENITVLNVSLQPTSTIAQIMGNWERRHDQAESSSSDFWDSGWLHTDGTGNKTFVHAMGVTPRTVIVFAAEYSGDDDVAGNPIPVQNTKVEVPQLGYEASQGQNFGFFKNRSDDLEIELGLAYWLADSSGTGEWLKDGDALIRVVAKP